MKKLGKLAALLALLLIPAMAQHEATAATSPCPSGCGYKWNPVSRCCITDPRYDCFDICY
jgi:hypothetical protein